MGSNRVIVRLEKHVDVLGQSCRSELLHARCQPAKGVDPGDERGERPGKDRLPLV